MRTLAERVDILFDLFVKLENEPSLLVKRAIIDTIIDKEMRPDFVTALEVLDGRHKLGYRFPENEGVPTIGKVQDDWSLRQLTEYLQEPRTKGDLSAANIYWYTAEVSHLTYFLAPLYNREWRLGIGRSLLEKDAMSPMLAKKYGDKPLHVGKYAVTEKLDGNRCIAYHDGNGWHFQSRSGKPMNVEFDMSMLPTDKIYDGEILSRGQVEMSEEITRCVQTRSEPTYVFPQLFSATSGMINRKTKYKNLVYNIFDVMEPHWVYFERRAFLNECYNSSNVRILPLLTYVTAGTSENEMQELLGKVVRIGGEGLMLNHVNATYQHKRTDAILKYKDARTIDMRVKEVLDGEGKYFGQVGALLCEADTDDGRHVICKVGTGLSDKQRMLWSLDENLILNKIVEVEYFGYSQPGFAIGTHEYSLRFPRLKRVREDKSVTSEY